MSADKYKLQCHFLDHEIVEHLLLAIIGDLFAPAQVLVQQIVIAESLFHQYVLEGVLGLNEAFLGGLDTIIAGPQPYFRREACLSLLSLLRLGPCIHNLANRLHIGRLILYLLF